jgi:DNA-binding transcriptional ArsR family regulator
VIYLHLGVEDLGRIRFAFSPAWETVTSLRTLGAAADTGLHGWWLRAVRSRLGQADMRLLTAVVRPRGYIPDFLHPFPPRRAPSIRTADPQPALTYAPRGLGRLWETPHPQHRSSLGNVLGHARATLLGQLDLPMTTTQLATLLGLTAPTLNAHLKALQAAGLVSSRQDGRSVLYTRTELGERLLAGRPGQE